MPHAPFCPWTLLPPFALGSCHPDFVAVPSTSHTNSHIKDFDFLFILSGLLSAIKKKKKYFLSFTSLFFKWSKPIRIITLAPLKCRSTWNVLIMQKSRKLSKNTEMCWKLFHKRRKWNLDEASISRYYGVICTRPFVLLHIIIRAG